ncbi:MAG: Hpt domain-containing protein [Lachnospiraceae bacterium]|nr:Hpt domain-containing protein [Lachnospiraceae bacterium]
MTDWKSLLQYEESFFHRDVSFLIIGSGTRNQTVLVELLQTLKAFCEVTTELESGIRYARSGGYDMIFIDEMYLAEGAELVREQFERCVPVIVLSDRFQYDKAVVQESEQEYFLYPITSKRLLDVLQRYFCEALVNRIVPRKPSEVAELYLVPRGFDVSGAMKYVADDFEQYIHLLKRFTDDEERRQLLKEAYANKDWGNYVTYVHALKNSARLIGATELADMAYEHEEQALAAQYEAIEETYQMLRAKWKETIACVKDYLEHCIVEYGKGEVQIAGVLSEDVFRDKVEQVKKYLDTFQKKEALMLLRQLSAYKTDKKRLEMIEQAIIALERYDYDGVMQILAGEL